MNAPGEDLAPAALAIARIEYPSLDAGEYLDAIERMGADAATRVRRTGASGQDAIKVPERVPLRRAAVHRKSPAIRRSAEQLPERSARSAHRHSHQPRGGVSRSCQTGGGRCVGRQLPRAFPAARLRRTRTLTVRRGLPDRRSVPRRGASVRNRLPRDAASARWRGSGLRSQPAGARDPARDRHSHARQSETAVRPHAIVSAGTVRARTCC